MNGWIVWDCLHNKNNGKEPGPKAPAPHSLQLDLRKESENHVQESFDFVRQPPEER